MIELEDLSPAELRDMWFMLATLAERNLSARKRRAWMALAGETERAWQRVRSQWTDAAVLVEEAFEDEDDLNTDADGLC